MVSFALAGFAGALKGAGQSIKDIRELKLKQLEIDQRGQIAAQQIAFNEKELGARERMNAAQLAASKEQTAAQLGVQTKLGELQAGTQKSIAELQATTTASEGAANRAFNREELTARTKQIADQIASGEKIAGAQITAQKDLQNMQSEAAQQLGIKPLQTMDGKQVWTRPDGKRIEGPKDENGKEISLAITDTDTDEMKNIKYLMTNGMTFERAQDTILAAKNANRNLAQVAVFKSMVDGASTMKSLGEDDLQSIWKQSGAFTDTIYGGTGGTPPAAPASAAAAAIAPPLDANGKPDMAKMKVDQPYMIGGRIWVKNAEGRLREVTAASGASGG